MSLTESQKQNIEQTIIDALRAKFKKPNAEPSVMPFHTRLLGKDRLALYSFIHSLNTNFGTTIFEPVAVSISSQRFQDSRRSVKAGGIISSDAQLVIEDIMNKLSTTESEPNKQKEIEQIRAVCQSGTPTKVKLTKQDLFLKSIGNEVYLIDIKTAKPNKGGFQDLKRTLLKWCAAYLYENPEAIVHSVIAIPYNPYDPKPYERWTMKGMMDLKPELLVAEEFWDFLGGEGTYTDLLDCFERAGITMRKEIDDYFDRFKT